MAYEIDFVGHPNVKDDYDAICFRFWDESKNKFINCVFDGGFSDCGIALYEHIKNYYSDLSGNFSIDYVFCSHGDQDHAAGLKYILENCEVKKLIVNFPWDYCDDLFPLVYDGRITKNSLQQRLKEKYPYLVALEEVASKKGVEIVPGLTTSVIHPKLKIISPSRNFLVKKLAASDKTPAMDDTATAAREGLFSKIIRKIKDVWYNDSLREDIATTPDNESSIILWGNMQEKNFLLMGDAGKEAITEAINYFKICNMTIKEVIDFYQVPHHGGRHNVTPSILNQLLGPIISQYDSPTKTAFVSVGKGSDHPKKMVVNAFLRRGCNVYVCETENLCHHHGDVPNRGWTAAKASTFSEEVEDWND